MNIIGTIALTSLMLSFNTPSFAEFDDLLVIDGDNEKSITYYRKEAEREKLLTDIARAKRERIRLGMTWNESDGSWSIRKISDLKATKATASEPSIKGNHSVEVGGLSFNSDTSSYSDYKLVSVMNNTATITYDDDTLKIKVGQRLPSGDVVTGVSVDKVELVSFENEVITLLMEL